jgi:type IV pilus assembly protein PilQ
VAGGTTTTQTETQRITTTETYGATTGPLKGLTGTTDSRLQTITLVGDPLVIAVAENYLRQLDLRQRQVALTVRILDVNLSNDTSISNSFAFRYGNNFIINNGGELAAVWGNVSRGNTLLGSSAPSVNSFWNELRATIESGSTKLLASPTLILTDNPEAITGGAATTVAAGSALGTATIGRERQNEAFVTVGTQVVTNYTVSAAAAGTASNIITCLATFGTAGLTFGARVSKIDDNGFVTFSLSPSVSATTDTVNVLGCGPAYILSVRRLDTGSVRVRDGQTLILTGVISDLNAQTATKWPILGDLPLVGQFFRNSNGIREKRELVIMVTPRIINDTDGGAYGYGYQPSSAESRQLMGGSAGRL